MKAFQRFLTQQAERAEAQYDGLVEGLLQRVSESVLVGDRREALAELRDLLADAPRAQAAFGTLGFPVVAHVVRERDDIEMVRSAVECMNLAVGGGSAKPGEVRRAGGGAGGATSAAALCLPPVLLGHQACHPTPHPRCDRSPTRAR